MSKGINIKVGVAVSKAMQKINRFRRKINKLGAPVNRLNEKFKRLRNVGVAALAGLTVISLAVVSRQIVTLGANMEQTRVSFSTMMGSVEKANRLIAKLNNFSNVTPFTNNEVIKAGKVLLAFGFNASSVTKKLKTLGDISAGTGKDFNELTVIYGKAKAAGIVQGEILNQLIEAGVPIIKQLADQLGVAENQIKKMASQGKISFNDLDQAFIKMTSQGGMFTDMMKKQSETLAGKWSTLVGSLQLLGASVGESLLPAFKIVVAQIQKVVDKMHELNNSGKIHEYISMAAMTVVNFGANFMKTFNTIKEYSSATWNTISSVVQSYIETMQMGIFGYAKIVAIVMNKIIGIVNSGLDKLNSGLDGIRKKLKKIGVDIPEFKIKIPKIDTGTIDTLYKSAKQKAKEHATKAFTGQYYKDASKRIEKYNKAIDKKADSINNKIAKWQGSQQDKTAEQKRQSDSINKPEPEEATETKVEQVNQKLKKNTFKQPENLSDRLSRIGLNVSGQMNKIGQQLDKKRNTLLNQIARGIGTLNENYSSTGSTTATLG